MAVFPDRIVLKNSTDSQAAIEATIGTGGSDEIQQGELVLGIDASDVSIYTKTGDGSIVRFAPSAAAGRAIISDTPPTVGINGGVLTDGDMWFESDSGSYYVYYVAPDTTAVNTFYSTITTIEPFSNISQASVATTAGGGTGAGATANVATDASGNVTSATIVGGGFNYNFDQYLTLSEVFGNGVAEVRVYTLKNSDWIQVSGGGGGNGVAKIVAGNKINIDPVSGLGNVTVNSDISLIEDLDDVIGPPSGSLNSTSFDGGQPTFADPASGVTAGTIVQVAGDNAYEVLSTVPYGDGTALSGFLNVDARYDVVNLKIRSTNAIDTNNRVSIGGNKQSTSDTTGFGLYTRNTGFGLFANSTFEEFGTRPTMNANTWYEITYVLDWGSAQRSTLPTISLWVDGAIAVSQATLSVALTYTEKTGVAATDFRLLHISTSPSNQGTSYWDDIRVVTSNRVPWGTADATISSPAALMDAFYTPTPDGHVLTWNSAISTWEPRASTGGGGGGGGLAYWGGGDFTTGTSDGQPADGGLFT